MKHTKDTTETFSFPYDKKTGDFGSYTYKVSAQFQNDKFTHIDVSTDSNWMDLSKAKKLLAALQSAVDLVEEKQKPNSSNGTKVSTKVPILGRWS